jgi:dTDP-4-amino-4,6-dideoxygalactose transaminase
MDEMNIYREVRLSKSCIGPEEKAAVLKVLDHEFLGMGAEVHQFETELKFFFSRPAVCVNTGTAAIQLALQALGIGAGDEVLVQALTYVATFQAIAATGAKPIACDIDKENFCIDLDDATRKFSSRTKAIIPVHYAGGVGNLESIYNFARKRSIRVVEDAAHAFGTSYKNRKIGSFGDIACFSFDGIKNITSGEGGCVITDDQDVLKKIQDSRLLGVENDTDKRFQGKRSWEFDVNYQGWRYHMSNIMAAIGTEQLAKFEKAASDRQRLAKRYVVNLSKCPKVRCLPLDYDSVVPHIFVVQNLSKIERSEIIKQLASKKIQLGVHYLPNHKLSYFKDLNLEPLLNTDALYKTLITLPLHPDLCLEDVDYVSSQLIDVLQ